MRAIERALDAGRDIEPVKVAKVGRCNYLVDGWHRLEALESVSASHVDASVARMDERQARLYSLTVNASHGKSLSRADKQAALVTFVELKGHLDANGDFKPSRTISVELGGIYSHEAIRYKLKAMGLEIPEEIEFPNGYKPHPYGIDNGDGGDDFDDELEEYGGAFDPLEGDRVLEVMGYIEALASLLPTLNDVHQREVLKGFRGLVERLESGEWPGVAEVAPLDI